MTPQQEQTIGANSQAKRETGVPQGCNHSIWLPAPAQLQATHDEVHVWRVSLHETHATKLQSLLDDDERMRAARFRFNEHRHRFIVARGALRSILGGYLETEPAALQFSYGDYGKPALADGYPSSVLTSPQAGKSLHAVGVKGSSRWSQTTDQRSNGLNDRKPSLRSHLRLVSRNPTPPAERGTETKEINFNLSHSRGFMLLAVTRGREVGVDIELIDRDFATAEVAERFFSRREILSLRSQPDHLQTEAFFHCWTRKEAYIKARGEGLSLPLDQFDVSLEPSGASLLDNRISPGDVARWSLQELHPAPDYCAAVAVEGFSWKLRLLDFNSSSLV